MLSVTPAHCQTGREVEVGHAVARTGHQETPRVLRETEDVETELNNLIANPQGIAQRQPDFRAMTQRVLRAFVDQPFESNRRIPEADPEAQRATRSIENGHFEPQEIREMTGQLLGRKLLARAFGTPSPLVETKLVCDTEAAGPARVTYEIGFPDEGLPGWTQTRSPVVVEGGYTQFGTRVPFPPKLGAHVIKYERTWPGREAKPKPRAISCGSPLQKFHQTGSPASKSAKRNDFLVVAQRLEMRGPHAPQVRDRILQT